MHVRGGRTVMLATADIDDQGLATMPQENILARYRISHELGRGAIGAVYAARDRETGGVVALKRLDPALLSQSGANLADRFLKHARSAQLLKHRNIVEIRDAGAVAGTVYVAMEMLEGESLRKILDDGPLPIARAIQIARGIACGLAHAHLEGVVHGGLKPSNIIVLRSGAVKITDFGIAQLGQAALPSGAAAACLSYLSPEQVRGDPLDHRCDIFSLGALFYEMLTHRPAFEGESPKKLLANILHATPPLPSELNPHVPRAVDGIVSRMLAGQPAARMPGVPVLLSELQRLEGGLGLAPGANARAHEPATSVPPAAPETRPRTPEPERFRDRAPMRDAPRFERYGDAGEASEVRIGAAPSPAEELPHRDRMPDREAFDYQKAMLMMERELRRERSSRSRPAMLTTLVAVVLAVLGIGAAGFMYYSPRINEPGIAASRMQEAPVTAPLAEVPRPLAQAESVVARAPEQPLEQGIAASGMQEAPAAALPTEESRPLAQTESLVARAPEQPASGKAAPTGELPEATQQADKVAEQPHGTAQLIVAVSPRGEIYVDGKHYGTTPPMTTFHLEPGMHRIEVRSGSRRPYLTYMTVRAGDVRRIRHHFDASRAVPAPSASWQDRNRPAR